MFLWQIITDIRLPSAESTHQLCESHRAETLVWPQGILCTDWLVLLLAFSHMSGGLRMQDKNFPTLYNLWSLWNWHKSENYPKSKARSAYHRESPFSFTRVQTVEQISDDALWGCDVMPTHRQETSQRNLYRMSYITNPGHSQEKAPWCSSVYS